MRAALASSWPALSAVYGLHPWDLTRLSFLEIETYVAELKNWVRQ